MAIRVWAAAGVTLLAGLWAVANVLGGRAPPSVDRSGGGAAGFFLSAGTGTFRAQVGRFEAWVNQAGDLTLSNGATRVHLTREQPAGARWTEGSSLALARPDCVELLSVADGELEQQWRFPRAPARPIRIALHVEGAQSARTDDRGLSVATTTGALRYGHATWVDAQGVRTPVRAHYADGAIVLEVDGDLAARSSYPAVLDPTLSLEAAVSRAVSLTEAPRQQLHPAFAHDPASSRVLMVWEDERRDFSGNTAVVKNIFGLLCDLPNCTQAQPLPISVGLTNRTNPAVTFANGRFFVAWEQGEQPNRGIYGAFVPPTNAMPPLTEIVVRDTAGDEFRPSVAYGAQANTIAVVYEHSPVPNSIELMLVDPTVPAARGPVALSTLTNSSWPTVGWTSSGFYAAWGNSAALYHTMAFTDGGVGTLNGTLLVSGVNAGMTYVPFTAWGNGAGLVAWAEIRPTADPNGHDIFFTRLSSSGAVLDVGGRRLLANAGDDSTPRVVTNGTTAHLVFRTIPPGLRKCSIAHSNAMITCGGLDVYPLPFVQWHDVAGSNGQFVFDSQGAIYDRGGVLLDPRSVSPGSQERPMAAGLDTGSLVVWQQSGDGGFDIRGRLEDGGVISISATGSNEFNPAVASSDAGYFVVWVDNRNGGGGSYDLYGARVSPSGQVLDPNGIAVNTEPQTLRNAPPEVVFTQGRYLVLWTEARLPGFQSALEAARVDLNGTVVDPVGVPVFPPDGGRGASASWHAMAPVPNGALIVAGYFGAPTLFSFINQVPTLLSMRAGDSSGHRLVSFGNEVWLMERAGAGPLYDVVIERLNQAGNPVAAPFVVGRGPAINRLSAAQVGGYVVAAWDDATDGGFRAVRAVALYPDGGTAASFSTLTADETLWPSVGSTAAHRAILSYVKLEDWLPQGGAARVYARQLSLGENGDPCTAPSDCSSGACTLGICCDRACTSGPCETCAALAGKPAGTCGFKPTTEECRASQGPCDRAEFCSGAAAACPSDGRNDAGTVCRPPTDGCDFAETCDGIALTCPQDAVIDAGVLCQSIALPCAADGVCDGLSKVCPTNGVRASGTTCRRVQGDCDREEVCDGQSQQCPIDAFRPMGTVCRAKVGLCDREETCQGSEAMCPSDALEPAGFTCRPKSNDECDVDDVCTGNDAGCPTRIAAEGQLCRAKADACHEDARCNGVDLVCPANPEIPGCADSGKKPPSHYSFGACGCSGAAAAVPAALWSLLLLRRKRRSAGVLLGVCLVAGSAGAQDSKLKVVWLGVQATSGVSEQAARAISENVQTELSTVQHYEVVSQNDLAAVLGIERQKQLLGCSDEASNCMAELAGALNAERLVRGDVSRIDDTIVLNLSLLDLSNGRQLARVGRQVEGGMSKLLKETHPMVLELAGQDPSLQGRTLERVKYFGGLVLGVRGDADLYGQAVAPGIFAELSSRWLGVAVTLLPKVNFGARLEGRFYPIVAGRFRPFVGVGAVVFTSGAGAHGGLGAAARVGPLQLAIDAAAEYFAAFSGKTFQSVAVLLGLSLGYQL